MASNSQSTSSTTTANVRLTVRGTPLELHMAFPTAKTSLRRMLPVIQDIATQVIAAGVRQVEAQGETISCKAGCGACCRQPVPIAPTEARQIRDLVEAMPEPRRSVIRERFRAARKRLEHAGLLDRLLQPESWKEGESQEFGLEYFRLGIACPFLEDESCSIHPDRPVACREYLVTSPAEECARPSPDKVKCVKLPMSVWPSLAKLEPNVSGKRFPWVPLILAPEWADAHEADPADRTGPEWIREVFQHLTGHSPPDCSDV